MTCCSLACLSTFGDKLRVCRAWSTFSHVDNRTSMQKKHLSLRPATYKQQFSVSLADYQLIVTGEI